MARILLIEDTDSLREETRFILEMEGYEVVVARNGREGVNTAHECDPDLILCDVMMPELDGFGVFRELRGGEKQINCPFVFLTARAGREDFRTGMALGADDYLTKPFTAEELLEAVAARLQRHSKLLESADDLSSTARAHLSQVVARGVPEVGPLVGESMLVKALRDRLRDKLSDATSVLLVGAVGVGKHTLARIIHENDASREGDFIYANCRVYASEHASGKLFGKVTLTADEHDDETKEQSAFALAERGSLFLDDIDLLPPALQAQLAERLLANEKVARQGETSMPAVRIFAATTRDVDTLTSMEFDPTLRDHLSGCRFDVPALAERKEDILALAEQYLTRVALSLGREVDGLSRGSKERLVAYSWPGNLRELQSVLERAVAMAEGRYVRVDESMLDARPTLGNYTLISELGEGGMGSVWSAQHTVLGRSVAIKIIRPEILRQTDEEQARHRFKREARALAQLRSLHTVEIYDFGIGDDGSFYYAMEMLYGMDLETMVDVHGPVVPERVIAMLVQACASLQEAHESKMIHRDIKPANLFSCGEPNFDLLKVLDFGLVALPRAKMAGLDWSQADTLNQSELSNASEAWGTPAFMAPEMIAGTEVDGRADLYSLACVAYWLLTGQRVFEQDDALATMVDHLRTPPRSMCEVASQAIPAELDEVVLACLAKKPEDRPSSADEVSRRLRAIRLDKPWTSGRAREWWLTHGGENSGMQGSFETQETIRPPTLLK